MNTNQRPVCTVDGCEEPHKARGWCRLHYERWQRTGAPLPASHADRLLSRIAIAESGCWLWLGATTSNGYGRFQMDGRHWMAHRAAYALLVEPIPEGLQLDHLCRTPRCVRPSHLEPVTARENTMRSTSIAAVNAAKTHCASGHPFTEDNTYLIPGAGGRACRECRRQADARHKARKKVGWQLTPQKIPATATA